MANIGLRFLSQRNQ